VAATTAAHATPTGKRPALAKEPLAELMNAGFEEGRAGEAPPAWSLQGYPRYFKYRATLVRDRPAGGELAVRAVRVPSALANGQATLVEILDARRIGDEAFVYASIDGAKPRTRTAQASVSRDFREVPVEIDVSADAERLTVGIVVTGGATATVDDVALTPIAQAPTAK
jgi:hypothetical protein